MGKTADTQETKGRSPSWARSLQFWANHRNSSNRKNHDPERLGADELPTYNTNTGQHATSNNEKSDAANENAKANGDTHGEVDERVKSAIADKSTSSRPAAAPPPVNTKDEGAQSTTIGEGGSATQKPSLVQRAKAGSVRFGLHTKDALLHSWINVLLIFVPIGIAVNFAGLDPAIIFAMNAVAIIPLAGLLAHATETVASRLGDTLGALLNVSFGNAVELIIFIALVKNEIRIVQASLLGSILANLLLILGMAFALGGLRFQEQIYNNTVTQMSAVMLSLSVMSLLLPTAFHASFADFQDADRKTLQVSRGTSVVLLLVYILYLLFQLKSHAYLYASMPQELVDEEAQPGILADMLDTSSSSSSSDSDSSASDTTSGSRSTAKKFKRFIRKRRKSSASSAESPSLPSHLSSPEATTSPGYFDGANQGDFQASSAVLPDIMSGDEGDNEHGHHQVRSQDFGRDGSRSPSIKGKSKKERKKHKSKKARKAEKAAQEAKEAPAGSEPATVAAAHQPINPGPQASVQAHDELQPLETRKSRTFARPTLPKLLSQNVFVDPPPQMAAPPLKPQTPGARGQTPGARGQTPGARAQTPGSGLRRTSSLPDRLNESNHTNSFGRQYLGNRQMVGRPLPPYANRGAWAARAKAVDPVVGAADEEEEEPEMSRTAAVVMLLISTGLVALCAEFLVDAIPAMTENSSVSEAFIGLIILPIVGNAAEHVTAVAVAAKNKMDLAIGVAVGSSIQIALFITPIVVILGWCLDKPMTLYFNLFETVSLFATVFVVNFLVLDGKSNYLEGVLLIAAYVIIAVAAFFYPDDDDQSALGGHEGPATNEKRQMLFHMARHVFRI